MTTSTLDDKFDDLKQFLTVSLSQTEARLSERVDQLEEKVDRLDHDLNSKIDSLDSKVDSLAMQMQDGFAGIADIVEDHNKQLDNHRQRITKLKQQAV